MKKSLKQTIAIGGIVVIAAFLIIPRTGLFSGKSDPSTGPAGMGRALPVSAIIVEPGNMENTLKAAGSLVASEEVNISTEIAGVVRKIEFDEGSRVKKGDLLVVIDDSELQAQREKAVYQKALIEQTLERQRVLLEKEAISREAFDKVQTDLLVIESEINLLNIRIQKTQIRAPFDGIIGFRNVSPGAYIQPGLAIARLVKTSPLLLQFSVAERYQSSNLVGGEVIFNVAGHSDSFRARVYAVEPSIDERTRSLTLRAEYPNSDYRLLPGMFADLKIIISKEENVVQVPSEAVIPQMDGEQVYVYRNGVAELIRVKSGNRTERKVAIQEGIQIGDTVITSGVLQLRSGMPVEISLREN